MKLEKCFGNFIVKVHLHFLEISHTLKNAFSLYAAFSLRMESFCLKYGSLTVMGRKAIHLMTRFRVFEILPFNISRDNA